jgi:hypothetical protein
VARMKRLDEIPLWLFALLTVTVFDGTALGGLVCARRLGHWLGLYSLVDNNTVGWIFSAILVIYAIAIGLIAVATWANASAASSVASQEASNIAALYRNLAGFPQPLQDPLSHSLVRYTQSIIQDAWPAQQRGEVTEKGIEFLLDFGHRVLRFEPTTDGQSIVHAEALRCFNTLVEFRRRRIEATSYAVPGSLWAVVLIGAALSIFTSYVFSFQSLLVQALMTTLLTSMIALLVFFIAATDHPYCGVDAIGPGAYEIVLRDLMDSENTLASGRGLAVNSQSG